MSKQVREHLPLLDFLSYSKSPKQLKNTVTTLTDEQVNAIGEVAVNVLFGIIPITSYQKNLLKKYLAKLEYIGDSDISKKRRKLMIIKHPGAVQALLTAAIPVLKNLL